MIVITTSHATISWIMPYVTSGDRYVVTFGPVSEPTPIYDALAAEHAITEGET